MIAYFKSPIRRKQFILLSGDVLIVLSAFSLAYLFRIIIYEGGSVYAFWERISWLVPVGVVLHILVFYVFELYDIEYKKPDAKLLLWLILSVSLATCIIAMTSYIFPKHKMGRVLVSIHVPEVVVSVFLWRMLFFSLISKDRFRKNLLWIDFNTLNSKFNAELWKGLLSEYNWVGTISDYKDNPGDITLSGKDYFPSLENLVKEKDIDTIVLTENPKEAPELKNLLIDFKFKGIEILDFPTLYQNLFRRVPILKIKGTFFLFSHQDKSFQPFIYLRLKRIFDVTLAIIGLVLTSPLFLFTVMAIKLTSKGPVFFTQERLGIDEKPFTLIKFRTMLEDAERESGPKWSSKEDPRITAIGKFLRKTRVDEIPQLINVLRGEMSFVGPRPIRRHFADLLAKEFPFYRLRFTVIPGFTGWAQVKGDYAGSMEGQLQKLEYELFYIQNRSIFFDLFILLKTVQTVIFRPGK
jgi:exopolysaccharide biosynthesis polyprenyl glycosylphosphotransferase